MRVTGNTPHRVKKIYIEGSQNSSTFHFDHSQGAPKDGIWFHVQGSTAAGDAAASFVARETAVSLSPPPQRAPPRPSNGAGKRKGTVAELGMMILFVSPLDRQQVPPRLLELLLGRSKSLNHHILDQNILSGERLQLETAANGFGRSRRPRPARSPDLQFPSKSHDLQMFPKVRFVNYFVYRSSLDCERS